MTSVDASLVIRAADEADLPELDRIAFAAKAHWGYSAAQLEQWRDELVTPPASLASRPVLVAIVEGVRAGFVQIGTDSRPWELHALWVDPAWMRRGIGRRLLEVVSRVAAQQGQDEIAIDADPHAEPFYRSCGAVVVGHRAAPVAGFPERQRVLLRLRVLDSA